MDIKEYIKNHSAECEGCGVLVAFSGTVKLDEVDYCEWSGEENNVELCEVDGINEALAHKILYSLQQNKLSLRFLDIDENIKMQKSYIGKS